RCVRNSASMCCASSSSPWCSKRASHNARRYASGQSMASTKSSFRQRKLVPQCSRLNASPTPTNSASNILAFQLLEALGQLAVVGPQLRELLFERLHHLGLPSMDRLDDPAKADRILMSHAR